MRGITGVGHTGDLLCRTVVVLELGHDTWFAIAVVCFFLCLRYCIIHRKVYVYIVGKITSVLGYCNRSENVLTPFL